MKILFRFEYYIVLLSAVVLFGSLSFLLQVLNFQTGCAENTTSIIDNQLIIKDKKLPPVKLLSLYGNFIMSIFVRNLN